MSLNLDVSSIVWSVQEADRAAALAERPLLVLLHGRGSNERDLVSLAPLLTTDGAVPLVVASLRAPLPLGDGYTWFPSAAPGLPPVDGTNEVVAHILDWLDSLALPLGQPIVLLGFSQGGALSTHLLRNAPGRFAAAVVLSGFSIEGEQPADAALEALRPPVFWGRDAADPVIPQSAIDRTEAFLPGHSTLTARLYPGIGHSISREELDDVREFLEPFLSVG